jgi:cell fate (sporulation/competence/biofilm development) regulator YlbF (YheA/YmcA/DUF963 family)
MHTILAPDAVISKTLELCETILNQPEYQEVRKSIDDFVADEETRGKYEMVSEKGAHLNHKQQSGVELTPQEISDFEEHRDALINNPVARRFMDAQEQMHQIKESVNKYVSKTFELGRLPTDADFEEGGCGTSSCGCHH